MKLVIPLDTVAKDNSNTSTFRGDVFRARNYQRDKSPHVAAPFILSFSCFHTKTPQKQWCVGYLEILLGDARIADERRILKLTSRWPVIVKRLQA